MGSAGSEGSGLGRNRPDRTAPVAEAGEGTDQAPLVGPGAVDHQDGMAACPKGGEVDLVEGAWDRDPVACRDIRASGKDKLNMIELTGLAQLAKA